MSLETLRSLDLAVPAGDINAFNQSVSDCNVPWKSEPLRGGDIYWQAEASICVFQESANFCPTLKFLPIQLGESHFPLARPLKKFGICQVLLGWPSDYLNRWKQGRLEHESDPLIRIVFQPPSNLPTVRQLKLAAGRTSVSSKAGRYISTNCSIIKCIDRISFAENRISPNCLY